MSLNLIGKKIKEIRKKQKMSQEKLAELTSVNYRTILRIENAQTMPTLDTLDKIAQVFNVSITSFFNNEDLKEREILIEDVKAQIDNSSDKELQMIYKFLQSIKI